jgi:hypothetical protein
MVSLPFLSAICHGNRYRIFTIIDVLAGAETAPGDGDGMRILVDGYRAFGDGCIADRPDTSIVWYLP